MSPVIEETAKQWLSDEVLRQAEQAPQDAHTHPVKLQLSPVSWVLPKLLRIVYANAHQPVELLAPIIRNMLQEQAFATTGGDPCNCDQLQTSIDQTVVVVVRVLEKVRQHCLAHPPAG